MITIGIVLSGCGVQDGSEITEAVLSLLALEKSGVRVLALAPDVEQAQVFNHYSGQEMRRSGREGMGGGGREVLAESARIVRGKIQSLTEVGATDLDGLILVGGYGVVKNLCTFARDGLDATVNADIERLLVGMIELGKPIGAMCISPMLVALALRGHRLASPLALTIGNEGNTAAQLERLGVRHQVTEADQICIDRANNIYSTPAYMLGESPAGVEAGINKLVEAVVESARSMEAHFQGSLASS